VLDEVEAVADHIKKIHFLDPDLPSTRKWTEKLCLELIKRKLPIHWRADLRPEDAEPELLRLFRQSGCEELLVPGAIRSLANRPISRPLEIVHNGELLVDPHHPYQGTYLGDEDSQRKPAYHNGTAWTWQFPFFCEAWGRVYGNKGKETALSWLASMVRLINSGCVGHVPEILDGDFPHTQRGCDAQAWGTSEFIRVWTDLQKI